MSLRYIRSETRQSLDIGLNRYMTAIYKYMALGLGLTGGLAFAISLMPFGIRQAMHGLALFAMLGTVGIVLYYNAAAHRINSSTARNLFWAYSALSGLSLATLFSVYYADSIAKAFLITAGTFGGASLYGYKAQKDLVSFGSFLRMGVWGIAIALIVNIFLRSPALDFALSVIGVIAFTGLAAYDTQRLRQMYYELPHDEEIREKSVIFGALTLYLDVINLFLFVLRLLGDRQR